MRALYFEQPSEKLRRLSILYASEKLKQVRLALFGEVLDTLSCILYQYWKRAMDTKLVPGFIQKKKMASTVVSSLRVCIALPISRDTRGQSTIKFETNV